MPPRILLWALDGEVRTWAPTELMQHATLRNGAAWHAAYGNVATLHYAHALVSQQRTIEAGRFRGLPAEESDSNCGVPPGWSPRVSFFLGGGTNTSSAKRVVIGSATVFMPVAPDLKFGYVMPPGARETLTRTACACQCALASLPVECACVCYVPPAAETCV